ncbi:MAG TPA: hypothetical protein VF333_09905 [Pyrinomonadaceae bacterium]
MKKVLMVLGGLFVAFVTVVVIAAAVFIPRALKLDKDAAAYIEQAVPKIAEHWDTQALLDRASPEFMSVTKSPEDLKRLFIVFRRLGALKHFDTPKGTVSNGVFSDTGSFSVGHYTVRGTFDHGAADITIQVRRTRNGWTIDGFHINSELFLPPEA